MAGPAGFTLDDIAFPVSQDDFVLDDFAWAIDLESGEVINLRGRVDVPSLRGRIDIPTLKGRTEPTIQLKGRY